MKTVLDFQEYKKKRDEFSKNREEKVFKIEWSNLMDSIHNQLAQQGLSANKNAIENIQYLVDSLNMLTSLDVITKVSYKRGTRVISDMIAGHVFDPEIHHDLP